MKERPKVKDETRQKYSESITLYTDTDLSIKEICEQTGVGFSAFSSYLSRHHRDLILKRHNLTNLGNVRLRGQKGQTTAAHTRYSAAIEACSSMEYIEYNISQIARIFGVDRSSLANQLRRHYPQIIPQREAARRSTGIIVNLPYGPKRHCIDGYAEAVEMLRSSDMTVEEAATACNVSYAGLREHVISYHQEITSRRESRRSEAKGQKTLGGRNGNWAIHGPAHRSTEKYAYAVELYRSTSLGIAEIAGIASVNPGGLRHHLRTWHRESMLQRRGYNGGGEPLEHTKRYSKATSEKYADAISRLRDTDLPTSKVASEFGLNPEAFRLYIKEHHPALAAKRSMLKDKNGKTISRRSAEKYAEALHLYETTAESLKSIAGRLGLAYNSVGGYIRRNHPEAIEKHKRR